jgi:hypothetical protein
MSISNIVNSATGKIDAKYIPAGVGAQTLSLVSNNLSITDGNTIDIGGVLPASTANISTGGLAITTVTGLLNVTGDVLAANLRSPAFVYYVSTNGRLKTAGATGAISNPFSLIADALTMPSTEQGMVIYVAPGTYNESFTVTISNTLKAVSIIGLSDDTRDSKRAYINGTISIVGTVVGHTNTINTVVLDNLRVSAPAVTTNAVYVSGVGIRVYLKNGLYSSSYNAPIFGQFDSVIQVTNTGTTKTNRVQLVVNNCSVTATGTNCPLTYIWGNAQILEISNSDFTNNGGNYALYTNIGSIGQINNSGFTSTGATAFHLRPGLVAAEDPLVDNVTNISNSYFNSVADSSNPIIAINNGYQGPTVVVPTVNISLSTLFNNGTETLGAASTTKYLDINTAGVIAIQRSQIVTKNKPSTITPYKTNTAVASGLYYFGNTYLSGNINVGLVLPAGWGLGVLKLTTEP